MPSEPKIRAIQSCRCCGNQNLVEVLSLGVQSLTGVFPRTSTEQVSQGPLELVKCHGEGNCGLLQLRHSFDATEMYGRNYGYRSSLNHSMVHHLKSKVVSLMTLQPIAPGDVVLDIGSNDGTLLSFVPAHATRIGMDPTIAKFQHFYAPGIVAVADFFSAKSFFAQSPAKARLVTSIAMFYDLESPVSFMEQVAAVLTDDGLWHFEQSYMPSMLSQNAYDTICHEHLEYYALHQIQWMAAHCGLRILEVELNDVNGGSFAVTACKQDAPHISNLEKINAILDRERRQGLHELAIYEEFKNRVFSHRDHLREAVCVLTDSGSLLLGYGASTKGNVILQFCGFGPGEIPAIAEVNEDKFGSFTPGTHIPIISEVEAHARHPDYLLVFPWHFRSNLIDREAAFLAQGGRMIFPLPSIDIHPS